MKPIVAELRGVSKFYGTGEGRIQALRNVTLRFHSGELVLVEGPSGGGKTTLLQILGLLLPADEGSVILAGEEWSGHRETELTEARRQHVAFIFQDFNLLSSLSAHDNVAVVAALHHERPDAVAGDILNQLGLTGRDAHLPSQMSGGQKQRVCIGRAMASPGELVLADEPTANLDWSVGEPIVRMLRRMAESQGRCVVVVSHDARLEPFADRIVRLADGRILAEQTQTPVQPAEDATVSKTIPSPSPARPTPAARRWRLPVGAAILTLLVAAVVAGKLLVPAPQDSAAVAPSVPTRPDLAVVAAAPAVVEPSSRLIQISSDRAGTIKAIHVRAGQTVRAGQILIELDDEEALAQVEMRKAELASSEAAIKDLLAWTRPEKREEAAAQHAAALARLDKAQYDYDRIRGLEQNSVVGTTEVRGTLEALAVARAEVRRTEALLRLAQAGPTPTELKRAEARVAEAKAQLETARASLERRRVRSPRAAQVLYVHMEAGEVVNPLLQAAPILSLAAAGKSRLRAEVDEIDIGRIHVGQPVTATTEAFPGRCFNGRVSHMEMLMGRRNFRTNRPTEKQDTRVREVVIELDEAAADLPVDLLMTVRFLADDARDTGSDTARHAPDTQNTRPGPAPAGGPTPALDFSLEPH